MRSIARLTIVLAVLAGVQSFGQLTLCAQDAKETGTITGRVSIDGKPAQGVTVIAQPKLDPQKLVEPRLNHISFSKAATDSDGRYRLEGVTPGAYIVIPSAPNLVSLEAGTRHREVTVAADSTLDKVDFAMARGGVITGRITDSDGRPAIASFITISPFWKSDFVPGSFARITLRMFFTDDRGVYRIFGIPAGRYLVSAGNSDNSPLGRVFAGPRRVKTYYPGVTDEASAKLVEVAAGTEAAGIDIKLGAAGKGFVVSGRVIDAESRRPVAGTMVIYAAKETRDSTDTSDDEDDGDIRFTDASGFKVTNSRGEFRLESVAPGRFKAKAYLDDPPSGSSEYYADSVDFEVRSANVENLEIKIHRGASISGVVVLENSENAEAREQIARLALSAFVHDSQTRSLSSGAGKVAADGSFRIGGLKAGKARIEANANRPKKVSIVRVERNGVEQQDGFLVQPNEQITGVRLVMAEANCLIRGHVNLQGTIPPGSTTRALARLLSGPSSFRQWGGPVDAKGDFVIENLAPGSYEVWVFSQVASSEATRTLESDKQTVSVASGIPAEVSLVLDLTAVKRDK